MRAARTFTTTLRVDAQGGKASAIEVPFDPKAVFGKVRAPVRVTLNRHTYRSTVFRMCGETFVPLRHSHQQAAGVKPGQRVEVTLAYDDEPREVPIPALMRSALKKAGVLDRFEAMSFTHRREYVEAFTEAKRPETRQKRLDGCVAAVRDRPVAGRSRAKNSPKAR